MHSCWQAGENGDIFQVFCSSPVLGSACSSLTLLRDKGLSHSGGGKLVLELGCSVSLLPYTDSQYCYSQTGLPTKMIPENRGIIIERLTSWGHFLDSESGEE